MTQKAGDSLEQVLRSGSYRFQGPCFAFPICGYKLVVLGILNIFGSGLGINRLKTEMKLQSVHNNLAGYCFKNHRIWITLPERLQSVCCWLQLRIYLELNPSCPCVVPESRQSQIASSSGTLTINATRVPYTPEPSATALCFVEPQLQGTLMPLPASSQKIVLCGNFILYPEGV